MGKSVPDISDRNTAVSHRQKIIKGLISAISFGIGPILSEYLPDAKLKKLESIIQQVNENLEQLEGQIDEDYIKRDEVLCLIEKTFRMISDTSDANKLMALKNALVRVMVDKNIEVDRKDFYINLLNDLTAFHFRMLSVMYDTDGYLKINNRTISDSMMGGRIDFFKEAIPDMNQEEISLVYDDLVAKRLVQSTSLGAMISASGVRALKGLETKFGQEFMNFFKQWK